MTTPDADRAAAAYLASGDPRDLGSLYDATAPELYRAALRLAPDAAAAEDALQETFLTASAILARWDPTRPVLPWLAGILRLKVLEGRRRDRRDRRAPASPPPPVEDAPEGEDAADVRAAIDGLPEPYRSVAILRWRYGLSPAQIADVRDEAPGTTSSILSRALDRLRGVLGALPAVFFGPRAPRGLEAVRADVCRRAVPPRPAGTSSPRRLAPVPVAIAAGVVALVAGGVAWRIVTTRGESPAAPAGLLADAVPAAGGSPAARLATAPAGAGVPVPAAEGARVFGRVVDEAGRPVTGAAVAAFPGPDAESLTLKDAPAPGASATTGADGAFEMRVLTDATFVSLRASAAGYAPALVLGAVLGREAVVVVRAPASLEGRVYSPEGEAVAGAVVRIHGRLETAPLEAQATTDASGAYRIDGLPPTMRPRHEADRLDQFRMTAEVSAAGFASRVVGDGLAQADPLRPGRTSRWDFVLPRKATVSGRVVDAETRKPVAGARVRLSTSSGLVGRITARGGSTQYGTYDSVVVASVVTGEDGTFRFDAVPAVPRGTYREPFGEGSVALTASAAGFASATSRLPAPTAGEAVEDAMSLRPAGVVQGRVVDGDGRGAARAAVTTDATFAESEAGDGRVTERATTDHDGRFRLEGVAAARDAAVRHRVYVHADEGSWLEAPETTVVVRAGEAATVPDIVLARRPAVSTWLEVVDESGAPVLGAHVERWFWADRRGRIEVLVPSDPNGKRPAAWDVAADGFVTTRVSSDVAATAAEPRRVLMRAGRSLRGRVVTPAGAGVPEARVVALDPAVPAAVAAEKFGTNSEYELQALAPLAVRAHATTGTDGAFALEGLPEGTTRVVAVAFHPHEVRPQGGSLAWGSVDAAAGARDLVVALSDDPGVAFAPVEGLVVEAESGAPVTDVEAWLERPGESVRPEPSRRPGRFVVEHVPPGPWTLHVTAPGHVPARVDDVVAKPSAPALKVALSRGAVLSGRAETPERRDPEDRFLVFRRVEGGREEGAAIEAPLEADGSFRAAGFAPGAYRVEARARPARGAEDPQHPWLVLEGNAEVGFPPPDGAPVVLRLVPAFSLMVGVSDVRLLADPNWGRVGRFDAAKAAFSAASGYEVRDASGRVIAARPGLRDGAQESFTLAAGNYVVRLRRGDGPPEERAVSFPGSDARVWFPDPAAPPPAPRPESVPAKAPPAK